MTIPEKLKIEIEKLEEIAVEIENSAKKLFVNAPLKYQPISLFEDLLPSYRWDNLTEELKKFQTELVGKYRGWYQSSKRIVEKYLNPNLEQFVFYYLNTAEDSMDNLLLLNFQTRTTRRQKIIKRFEKCFSIQRNLLSSIKFLEISQSITSDSVSSNDIKEYSSKVFIVHGHDEIMKTNIEIVIKKLKLEPIILHQQPNEGKTIIEKFTKYSEVGVAIILLSPDDKCKGSEQQGRFHKSRARQNVILEMGFFMGKLGRERVIILYKTQKDFEFPSDYLGVLYIPYDSKGSWKLDLIKELKSLGYSADANLLV